MSNNTTIALSDQSSDAAPHHLLTDYVELCIHAAVLLIGLPINAVALRRLVHSYAFAWRSRNINLKVGFILLKIHLTAANLLVIMGICPMKIGWLITYRWIAGNVACKLCAWLRSAAMHQLSYIVVCIALDRLSTVRLLSRMAKGCHPAVASTVPDDVLMPVKRNLMIGYVLAVLFSLPQMFVWCTITVGVEEFEEFTQCTTVWHAYRVLFHQEQAVAAYPMEQIYEIAHLITVFWGPFLLILIAYGQIVYGLLEYSLKPYSTGEVPTWRLQMRSRMFRTTAYVLLAYVAFWLPYNIMSLVVFVDDELSRTVSSYMYLFQCSILWNAVINPFIYGFQPQQ